MSRIYFLIILFSVYCALDIYVFMVIRSMMENSPVWLKRTVWIGYWIVSGLALTGVLVYSKIDPKQLKQFRLYITTFFFVLLMGKLLMSLFLFIDDLRRGIAWLINLFPFVEDKYLASRSDFMKKSALVAGAVSMVTLSSGVISGAHDYRVRKKTIRFQNLPKAFDGLRVIQISDIHTGSFFNKTAVRGGVDMINEQKGDLVFFTGDLVNNQSKEAKDYLDIFKKISAPIGVYSIMGNHDYGDYHGWSSLAAKQQDIEDLHTMHRYMGWNILLNENRVLKVNGEEMAILGCENWGSGRFSKYGDMNKTIKGVENHSFKILLSHDPSHWDAQIRPEYSDIDLTLAGHTHGFQFGIEIGDFRWSPVQYRYKQWADLYQEKNQFLYVNRGFGFIGYPGRVGILPEITVLELKSS